MIFLVASHPVTAQANAEDMAGEVQSGTDQEGLLQQLEQAFRDRRYKDVLTLSRRFDPGHVRLARVRFLQGYAHYKLGDLERAAHQVKESLSLGSSQEAAFLAGMVALEQGHLEQATRHLKPLASSATEPWKQPAIRLLERARHRMDRQRYDATLTRHDELIRDVEAHLRQGRQEQAARELRRAEQALPGHLLNHYYRGYLSYVRGDKAMARRHLRKALEVDAEDEHSRYMLALTLEESEPGRSELLRGLAASGSQVSLRRAASKLLGPRLAPNGSGVAVQLELAGGMDTNPSYFSAPGTVATVGKPGLPTGESPAGTPTDQQGAETAMAIRAIAGLAYRHQLSSAHRLGMGVRALEQAYAVGPDDLEQTEIAGWLSYQNSGSLPWDTEVTASYGYTLYLTGHEPLLSLHEIDITGHLPLKNGLALVAGIGFRALDLHGPSRKYQDTLQLTSSAALRVRWQALTLQAGYTVMRSWTDPVEKTISTRMDPTGAKVQATYLTDFSATAHGPQLFIGFALPWRLSLDTAVWLLWHHFDNPEQFILQPAGSLIWEEDRQDLQIMVGMELRRPLVHGLEVLLNLSAVDNLSSLDTVAPVNRAYSRRLLLLGLRWRWPMR